MVKKTKLEKYKKLTSMCHQMNNILDEINLIKRGN